MKIRRLQKEDIPELLNLRIEQQKEYHECLNEEEKHIIEYTRDYINGNLNINKYLFMFGVFKNNEIVAICGYNVWNGFPSLTNHSGKIAYLCSAYTKQEYRGQGIMQELLDKSINTIKENGITRIKLNSSKENAIRIYSRLGFTKDETAMILDL